MAKYKAKDSFNKLQPRTDDNPLDLGSTQCLIAGGTIELEDVPEALKEHLVAINKKETIVTPQIKKIDNKKGVK